MVLSMKNTRIAKYGPSAEGLVDLKQAHRRLAGDSAGAEPRRTSRHNGSLVLQVSWLCVGGDEVTCTTGSRSLK